MSASQSGQFNFHEFTDLGAPLVGGRLYTYTYGTTAQKTAYMDHAGTIPHTYTSDGLGGQYIALNARGELPAPLYLSDGSYDLALKTAAGETVWTRRADPLQEVASLSSTAGAGLIGFDYATLPAAINKIDWAIRTSTEGSVNILRYIPPAQWAGIFNATYAYDCLANINTAIAALPGTFDVSANYSGNNYSGKPSPILFFPNGGYGVSGRVLVEKNNVCIRGAGWNASIIKYTGAAIINEVMRFRNSNTCELSDIGLDGGLPYNPTLTETSGANAGLCCDLTPFFTSRNLWIANARLSGLCAIHLWESYFENFQVRNTGYFTNEATLVKGAAIYFCADAALKESSNVLGSGYESDNTVFVKPKLVPVGAIVLCEAPTANITLLSPITENRDFATYFAALSYTKYTLANSNNFMIQGGYFYAHSHAYACNATLFLINANTPGISIKNFYTYTSAPTGYPEVTKIFIVAGQHPVCFDGLVIDDDGAKLTAPFTILSSAGYPGIVYGDIHYSAASTVTAAALIGGNTAGYKGTLASTDTVLQIVNRNTYFANARQYNTLTNTNQETFSCRAWCCFNGVTGVILASGNISGLVKNSTGNYTLTFTTAMPDANYAATATAVQSNSSANAAEIGGQTTGDVNIANRGGLSYYDAPVINVTVFR